ncbi:MAG: AIR synthase-related protein [Candidatus Lokiarchaeota archaeon]
MTDDRDIYSQLGVSSKKSVVYEAIKSLDKGLFPGAFCKIVKDVENRSSHCSIFHSDGAGTKSSLAYLYFKETKDIDIFRGIVRDAIVMNIDDIICVGATGNFFISNNIGRNAKVISGEIISTIIDEYDKYCKKMTNLGLDTTLCGGETADIGDIVKTILVDASVFTTMRIDNVINAANIIKGDVIIGLASFGKATYEEEYNSGIGSNGLTLARHGVLHHEYYHRYPECYDPNLDEKYLFYGNYTLTDINQGLNQNIGKALLSPTRTYVPIVLEVLKNYRGSIHGMIHNTGGGQTKDLNFGRRIKYIKNNLFKLPRIFEIIQNSSETSWREMYQVFNMGHRMEFFTDEVIAEEIIKIAKKYNVKAKIIGYCESSPSKSDNLLEIKSEFGSFNYTKHI